MSYGLDIIRGEVRETDDSGDLQKLKKVLGLASEEFTGVHRVQQFGLSSHAPQGSHGIILAPMGGQRELAVMLGAESAQHRQKNLKSGQTVLYDSQGNIIRLFGGDEYHLESKGPHITVKAPDGKKIYLGGKPDDGGTYSPVQTVAGPSTRVYARVD